MLIKFRDLTTLGVINITPNSFSDPQKKIIDHDQLLSQLKTFKDYPNLILDFGFESTAPMNTSITLEEERSRFDQFLAKIKDVDLSNRWISFDTYRPLNYAYFEEQFKTRYSGNGFIFNDVSGVIDSELLEFLKKKIDQENFYYIHSSTHIPSRDHVLDHMKFLNEENIIQTSTTQFQKAHQIFKENGLLPKIIFDPAFGFSKTYEQNWELINRFSELLINLKESGIVQPWLIGLSKKSFLRKALPDSTDPFLDSEILHAKIIKELLSKNLGHLLFRVHNPELVEGVYAQLNE